MLCTSVSPLLTTTKDKQQSCLDRSFSLNHKKQHKTSHQDTHVNILPGFYQLFYYLNVFSEVSSAEAFLTDSEL